MPHIATRGFPMPFDRAEQALRQTTEALGFVVERSENLLTTRRDAIAIVIRPIESTYVIAEAVLSRGRGPAARWRGLRARREIAPVWRALQEAATSSKSHKCNGRTQ